MSEIGHYRSCDLRAKAAALRDSARRAVLPGYAAKMIRAADDLEMRAVKLERENGAA